MALGAEQTTKVSSCNIESKEFNMIFCLCVAEEMIEFWSLIDDLKLRNCESIYR